MLSNLPRHLRLPLSSAASLSRSFSVMAADSKKSPFISLDSFARRQFIKPDGTSHPSATIRMDEQEFIGRVNAWYEAEQSKSEKSILVDGYAPFCKHLFMPTQGFLEGLPCLHAPITPENQHKLRSSYQARTPKELPVLTRYFLKGEVEAPEAKYLDLILYSREQINIEKKAMGEEPNPADEDSPWGLISIKPQLENTETPMQPITALRNALGVEEGGSGVPLDREAYMKAVEFWDRHATIVDDAALAPKKE